MADLRHIEHANPRAIMHSILQRIATGPELSKDVALEEARAGMRAILEGHVDPVQAGVFLIALRMKRETDDECKGVMKAILDATQMVAAPVDEVFHVVDPYDDFNRSLPPAPFLPPLLAAFGVASISLGVERMGPKYGITHRQVLCAAGQPVDLTPEAAAICASSRSPTASNCSLVIMLSLRASKWYSKIRVSTMASTGQASSQNRSRCT
jgi:anthranilate phosphoribosyltransferase